jgi:hypothetical protein
MNTKFAGENIFLEKFDCWCSRCYWWESMKIKTHTKLNVSIPIELHDFLIQKQKIEQAKNPLATIPLSKIVATAIEELKQDEEGKAAPSAKAPDVCDDDKIIRPSVLYPNGLPAEMRPSKKRSQSAPKKLPKKDRLM